MATVSLLPTDPLLPDVEHLEPDTTGHRVVRIADGGLTVAARDSIVVASEADSLVLTAATEIVLNVGHSTFTLRADGTILLNGRRMALVAPTMIELNPEAPGAPESAGRAAPRPCGCDDTHDPSPQ